MAFGGEIMNTDVRKQAKKAKDFVEITGESLSDRRVRYWKWKRRQTLTGYGRDLSDRRKITVQELTKTISALAADLNDVKSALAKLGINLLAGE